MPVTARLAAPIILALLGGVCVACAPVPVLTAVGKVFPIGPSSLTSSRKTQPAASRVADFVALCLCALLKAGRKAI